MKRTLYSFFIVLLFLGTINALSQNEFPLKTGTIVVLPDIEKAKKLISTEDEYTKVFSLFDLQSKTRRTDTPTVADYLTNAANQVLIWDQSDREALGVMVKSISNKIIADSLQLNIPDTIFVIKTTMIEEGGADGYTRGKCIFLKSSSSEDVLIHEMFHVLSRNDHNLRENVYFTLGFKKCNEVVYPTEIASLRISNPDAPHNDYYITVKSSDMPLDVMLVLYASKPYSGGSFFGYVTLGMMVVTGDENSKVPVMIEGKPQILEVSSVKNFYEQVGRNTGYIIHAEEVCADQFVMLLNKEKGLPNQELITAMKKVMSAH